ncbi:S-adenosyl-L-methionine-dependent methyltransferase [Dacryopinax primogenitus]|uniref:Trimethylguanosine synthase n=1 Tax=Dacryopinax primogenitus (strain DJM 731) TaxID=1858805 RepID=M5GFZ9_DACPD|nr:S-adenosyl-L-methionine-dependent methyltransferase [Dacryopinax primogenitus]EJU04618.1 S-adenosyl-L-methionine-dependent methyltransferase [Dacryopinax primogenitus]
MEEDVLSDKASLGGRPVLDGLPISNTTALQKERSHLADILQQDHWELGHLTRKSVPATGATSVAASLGPDGFPISRKRRKLDNGAPYAGPLPRRYRQWDASALVPYYTQKMDMPPSLQKWFGRRHHLFSLYDKGCLMDEVGWFSVTPEKIADQIAERCRCDVVLDAFCGVGGNAIAFARTCDRVIAIDNSSIRLALARHNAALYGVADRIEFILADYPTFARSLIQLPSSSPSRRKIDVVFMSPPWGGPEYNKPAEGEEGIGEPATYKLAAISPVHGKELFELSRGITKNVAYYLPRHVDLEEVSALLDKEGGEMVEVEEEWMANRLTAVTCYFGGLAEGQGDMFDEPTA